VPQIAAFPPKALIVGLGALCALLIAVAIAVLLEANDPTFRRAEHVEAATGLPVLAMVPQARHNQLPGRPRRSGQPAAAAHGEAIRRLPAGIELSAADRRSRVVLVSSAAPAEGKTTLVAELAWHAAANGKRVVAIDCDWRSPRLHRVFRCSNEQGLAALLGEQDVLLNDCLHADDASGVHVVPAGRWTPAMAHLLHYERLQLLLRAFAERYDLVLLDSPPVLVAADALALGRVADSAVLAVRWGHTRREAVLDALKQLIDVQADLAGIAVTRVVAREYRRYAAREARRVPAAAAVRA
jgi:capsular exopolysaccharide synthesis family protein